LIKLRILTKPKEICLKLQTAMTAMLIILFACPVWAGDAPAPLAAMSVPAGLSDMSVPAGLSDMSVPAGLSDMSVEGAGGGQAPATDTGLPVDYYLQKLNTVEGVITAVDLDNQTITIKDSDAEKTYRYDELTHFQVRLDQLDPSKLKVGSKIAGLYQDSGGSLYISRVVVILGEKATKRKSRHHRRRRR
jgi:Cu/Ag efflux protein CusF